MRVIEFFTAENKEHWLEELKKCDWDAGQYLHHLLKGNELKKMVGETALVPMWEPANAQISGAVKKRAWMVATSAQRL